MGIRKICVVIGSRANYSSIKSVMRAIQQHSGLELQVVAGASAVLDRYGAVVNLVETDGFKIDARLFMLIEGETPVTMAKSTGVGLMELPTIFERLQPDMVLTVGDRFETMATTLAAAYMNIPIAHTMGGEVTGTIDESIRHAVTKFAHIHFPASQEARERIIRLGEREEDVYLVGCPRIDLVAEFIRDYSPLEVADIFLDGVGEKFCLDDPFLIISQHPVTTEYGQGNDQIAVTLKAVREIGLPALVLWPNPDAGSADIARGLRIWREAGLDKGMFFVKNLPINIYIALMKLASCLVGNSSSGIREGAFIGLPVVNIGTRQDRRQRGQNVIDVPYDQESIVVAIKKQLEHGTYASDAVYGDGRAGPKIADVLSTCKWTIQKHITH